MALAGQKQARRRFLDGEGLLWREQKCRRARRCLLCFGAIAARGFAWVRSVFRLEHRHYFLCRDCGEVLRDGDQS